MSEHKTIDEKLFEIEGLDIEKRKKNPLSSILITLAGIVIVAAVYMVDAINSNVNLSSGLLFVGFVIAATGLIKLIMCFTGKGAPHHVPTGHKVRRYEFFFDQNMRDKIREYISDGDFETLADLPSGETSAIMAVIYKTNSDDFAIAQVLEYVPHYYRPLTDVLVFKKGDFVKSSKMK